MLAYKCTRPDATDFRTGTVKYEIGTVVEVRDADAADAALWPHWAYRRWYVRPRYALWRSARWKLLMKDKPNPWAPIVEMFRLGCMPIGYCKGDSGVVEFVVYCPEPK